MNVGLYQGATALDNMEKWQEVISQNIANSSVPGYKALEMSTTGLDYGSIQDSTGVKSSTQPAVMPSMQTQISFQQGTLQRTNNPTDLSVNKGFFVVQQPDGKLIYTRNGQFNISSSGILTNANGDTVQGTGGAVQLLNNGIPPAISASGEIRQGQQLIGKIKVVDFDDSSKLTRVAGGFTAANESLAKPSDSVSISQGFLEDSNVSTVNEMVKLIQASRTQEANQKVITNYDSRLSKTIQTFTR
jgi:flagellar basal body rod protein FlgG